ncbi:AAA family ATPase [Halomicrococcus sp. NG-SE-24]|uniref:AAA family ATPase n=1 Tax=Halomicrococcus sp. NG-SE-24 TaxID=3436928 RepID=UPI003D99E131
MTTPEEIHSQLRNEVNEVLIGNEEIIEGLTIALLTRGHVLLEGVPGVAKTTIANLFARGTGLDYNRIQMTPDLLPADITGTHVYREPSGEFQLQRGPVFSNLLVSDEINRATPKTQSALLEAMQEETVTIEGETLSLPTPFMVVATQNPIEMEGTYELPEAQRDRFQLKLIVELPDETDERKLLDRFDGNPTLGPEEVSQVVSPNSILDARQTVADVYVAPSVKDYIREVVAATRDTSDLEYGGSPRATIAYMQSTKARAAINGRDYVIPDDVKRLAVPVLNHRLTLSTDAELSDQTTETVLREILDTITPPSSDSFTEQKETATVNTSGSN